MPIVKPGYKYFLHHFKSVVFFCDTIPNLAKRHKLNVIQKFKHKIYHNVLVMLCISNHSSTTILQSLLFFWLEAVRGDERSGNALDIQSQLYDHTSIPVFYACMAFHEMAYSCTTRTLSRAFRQS